MAAGGFNARFVDELSDRYTCPICILALREPVISKCGHLFCNGCVRPLLRRGSIVCPLCRVEQDESEFYPDNYDRREIMNLKIYCDQQEKGCGWKGELKDRDTHNQTCGFVEETCKNGCGEILMRKDMENHMQENCNNRNVDCDYCKTIVTFKFLEDHFGQCEMYPVECEYCEEKVPRKEVNQHVSLEGTCPGCPLECQFSEAGCPFIGTKRELTMHLQNDFIFHLSRMMDQQSNSKALLVATRVSLAKRECELENLKSFITKEIGKPVSQSDICVFEWNITNWSEKTRKSLVYPNWCIVSEPFYSGPQGYCLCLKLYPGGRRFHRESHVSIDVWVSKGNYDDKLPIDYQQHCKFSFTLIDQQLDAKNVVLRREKTLKFTPERTCEAIDDFLSHETMKSRSYLRNNELFLQFCLQLNMP